MKALLLHVARRRNPRGQSWPSAQWLAPEICVLSWPRAPNGYQTRDLGHAARVGDIVALFPVDILEPASFGVGTRLDGQGCMARVSHVQVKSLKGVEQSGFFLCAADCKFMR